jgi:glycine cleavage system H protein
MAEALNKCVWMWAGLLTYRLCDREYRCTDCPVDSIFHPKPPSPSERATAGRPASGPRPSPDRFQDEQHLWVRVVPGNAVQIGLDPMAARLLEFATGFTLPPVGTALRRGDVAVSAHLPTGSVHFASPLSGEVVRIHESLAERTRSALRHSYTRGWLMILKVPRLERQLDHLRFGHEAGFRLAREWARFQEECLQSAAGASAGAPALPDGGELDLDRVHAWAGSEYPELISRWIGAGRLRTRPLRSSREGTNLGGSADPSKER